MIVRNGDVVQLRDGRLALVTDAADQGEQGTVEAGYNKEASMPAETIFVGERVDSIWWHSVGNARVTDVKTTGKRVVSDMSEVVAVLNA